MRVFGATIPGLGHQLTLSNNQDAFVCGSDYAVIADGCGSGKHSESGAWDAVEYVAALIPVLIAEQTPLEDFSSRIQTSLLGYLNARVQNHLAPGSDYVSAFLQFTLGYFAVVGNRLVYGTNGDFCLRYNGWTTFNNWDNHPPYLGFHLKRPRLSPERLSLCVLSADSIPLEYVRVFALATDGWAGHQDKLLQVDRYFQPRARDPNSGITRQLISWYEQEQCFDDDATLVGLIREE